MSPYLFNLKLYQWGYMGCIVLMECDKPHCVCAHCRRYFANDCNITMPIKCYLRPATIKTLNIFFEEVRQEVVIHNVMTVRPCPSSINQLLIMQEKPILESPKSLPPIQFIRVLNVNKDRLVEDQLKVIREDVLYSLNEVGQMLQVIKRFNQRLFSIEARLKVVEEGLRINAVVKG